MKRDGRPADPAPEDRPPAPQRKRLDRDPPALSRRVLDWAATRLHTPDLPADAAELFAVRSRRDPAEARRWYRRQARSALVRSVTGRGVTAARSAVSAAGTGSATPGSPPTRRPTAAWAAGLSLNARLGARMLVKHPGVSIVGVLAMAIGIGIGAGYLEVVNDYLRPTLPLDDGDRVVGLRNWDTAEREPELQSVRDFTIWRDELESVDDLAAFRTVERNLGSDGAAAEPAFGAEITPSAFRVARTPALLGRTLIDADEQQGAPPVVVLGHRLWQSRFGGDAGVIGSTARVGGGTATVVGVMPPDFLFPVNHEFWTPLRADALTYGPREGPAIQVLGRLADGVTLDQAQAELATLGVRAATTSPDTHARLRPQIMRYTELFVGGPGGGGTEMYLVVLLFVMLLLVLASNVATMVFARTATRESEIAMRYALGASRGQLLVQFFIEAFVLALAATVLGLAVVAWGSQSVTRFFWEISEGPAPFWLDTGLNATTVLYALLLAVIGSLVAGVLPAFRVTGARLQSRVRQPVGRVGGDGTSAAALRFGGLWGAVVVVQVTFAVLLVPPAVIAISSWLEPQRADAGFPTDEYLSARVELDSDRPPADSAEAAAFFARFEATRDELRRRLSELPGVSRVTFASALPGMDHSQPTIEVEPDRRADAGAQTGGASAGASSPGYSRFVMSTSVDADFFDAFGARVVAGRVFNSGDLQSDARVVVVNQEFVDEMLQGRNAVGRRVRPTGRDDRPWHEIVGVVSNVGMDTDRDPFHSGTGPGVYYPLRQGAMGAGDEYAVRVAFHVRGEPTAAAPGLRDIARTVDPALRLYDVLPLDRPVDRGNRNQRVVTRFATSTVALVAVIALIISMAGIYSVLAFTVARQTREIGIRIALGADRRRIIRSVFSRAMFQIGTGLAIGTVVWFYVIVVVLGGGRQVVLFASAAAVLVLVGAVACGVPVRRALRIEPIEALREG